MSKHVGIFLYDDVEVLDFAGPFEVFSTASRVRTRQRPGDVPLFKVFTVAQSVQPVLARGGLKILPEKDFNSHPPLDILIVPGGIVTEELEKEVVIQWIRAVGASHAELLASVCTGAFFLAKAGLLDGKRATTHWEDIPDLRAMFPSILVEENTRWVDEGKLITSAGISAGIDMALHLVARVAGEELAVKTARQMECDWQKTSL